MNGLLPRTLTAVFVVGIMSAAILLSAWSLYLLFAVILILCSWELGLLILPPKKKEIRQVFNLVLTLWPALYIGGSIFWEGHMNLIPFALVTTLWLFTWMIWELFTSHNHALEGITLGVLSFIYLGIPLGLIPYLANLTGEFQGGLVYGIVVLAWVYDTGAYLIGAFFGRRKIAPSISPKKTWEGAIAGLIIALLMTFALAAVFPVLPQKDWLALAVLISTFGLLGDMVESAFKRQFDQKDSGNLLPGHGGFLDRFDSLIFALPWVSLYLWYFF